MAQHLLETGVLAQQATSAVLAHWAIQWLFVATVVMGRAIQPLVIFH